MNRSALTPLDRLPARNTEGHVLAVIEARQGTRSKLKYEPRHGAFELNGVLPAGMAYPHDFGFIPSTLGEDGDPLDVLLLMDESVAVGSVVPCRLLGVVCAEQGEPDGPRERNDRLVAVAVASRRYANAAVIDDLTGDLLDEVERFFVFYNREKGVDFRPLRRAGPDDAARLLAEGEQRCSTQWSTGA